MALLHRNWLELSHTPAALIHHIEFKLEHFHAIEPNKVSSKPTCVKFIVFAKKFLDI